MPGAISATGKSEYEFNRRFADELLERGNDWPALELFILESSGKPLGLQQRSRSAAKRNANVFLSIHHDSVQRKYIRQWKYRGRKFEYSDVFSGFSLFLWRRNAYFAESLRLATIIGRNLVSAGFSPTLHHAEPIKGENRRLLQRELGIYAAPFVILRSSRMPAVLFEVGVIANRQEERRLEDPKYRSKIQVEILRSLQEFCRSRT